MPAQAFQETIPSIVGALHEVISGTHMIQWITPYVPCSDPSQLEAVLFLKPEGTDVKSGVNVEDVLRITAAKLDTWNLSVDSIAVLGSQYLEKFNIISQHYGVINQISTNGLSAISDDAKDTLNNLFAEEIAHNAEILGGHQLLQAYPDLTPKALDVLIGNIGFKKLAPGTYCTKVKIDGKVVLLLNGFHPYQIDHFTRSERAIVTLLVRGKAEWKTLRNDFLGSTSPGAAAAGSLRREFLEKRSELGIKHIDQGNNVVHFSAGPLEGMVETIRYFSDHSKGSTLTLSETCFGKLLLDSGFDHQNVESLSTNPQLSRGERRISAFDLTEETQPDEAVELLKP